MLRSKRRIGYVAALALTLPAVGAAQEPGRVAPVVQVDTARTDYSVGPVLVGAGLGAVAVTGAWSLQYIMAERQPGAERHAMVWAGGAALGAMIGAALADDRAAPFETMLGAAVAVLPFVVLAPGSGNWGDALTMVVVVPVVGATIGNAFGQGR